MGRRRRPVSWGGTRRGVLRFRLPLGAPLARHAPPSPTAWGGTRREVSRFRLPCGTPLARHAPPSPTEDGRVCGPGGCAEGQGLNSTLTTELSSGGRAALVRSMAIGLLKRAHSTPSRGSHSPWGRRQSESYCSSQHNSHPRRPLSSRRTPPLHVVCVVAERLWDGSACAFVSVRFVQPA